MTASIWAPGTTITLDSAALIALAQLQGEYSATVGGTADAVTLTPSIAITALAAGQTYKWIASGDNTGPMTVAISGLPAVALTKNGAVAMAASDVLSGMMIEATYDGTRLIFSATPTTSTGLVAKALKSATTSVDTSAAAAPVAGQVLKATSSTTAAWQTNSDPATAQDLVSYVHPTLTTGHRDVIKSGYPPAWFNQQWGGGVNYYELVDAATGTPYKFESATGYIESNGSSALVGDVAGRTWGAQGFKVGSTQSISAIWVKIYKAGNPTANLELRILPDAGAGTAPTGSTAITNGTATAISGKLFESGDTTGQWVRFAFATPCALTANTFYHIALKSSAAVDASNYWAWIKQITTGNYPHGNQSTGDGTPTWSATTTSDMCFLVEAPSTTQTFQSGGIFGDGKAVFYEGSPLNQSNQRRADLADLKGLTPNNMTLLLRGTAHTKDKTIADMTYGLDHDRVVVRCNVTTGYPSVTVYDSAGTASTVTGTTDISSGDHDVAVLVTTAGCSLWVDGASQGTPIVTTITFDTLFAQGQVGSLWIGGGFALAPTWSGSSISSFTGLPSTLGWTWTGVATEANAMSVSGGKLYQNKSGYTALQDGYYKKTTAGLSNANGWNLTTKERAVSATNTKDILCPWVGLADGAKVANWQASEYYMEYSSAAYQYAQLDLKTSDNVLHNIGKGSDCYSFVNGRLTVDGTGKLDSASATNEIYFGDGSTTSGESADVVWSYMKYYTTAALLPQATAGSLSEWAIWTGDKTSILATLWNSGSPISVKQFCGLGVNWKRGDDGAWAHKLTQLGITYAPTTTSVTTADTMPEMEGFVIGDKLDIAFSGSFLNSTANAVTYTLLRIDGGAFGPVDGGPTDAYTANATANSPDVVSRSQRNISTYFGPHKITERYGANAGTTTATERRRTLNVKARS